MSPADYQRRKAVFETALDAPSARRGAVIEELCAGDEAMAEDVRRLIRNAEAESSFLDAGAIRKPELQAGQVLCDRFELLRLAGEGGMGQVWAALDRRLGETVAIKTIQHGLAAEATGLARLQRELQLARRIGHPNVCRVYELFDDTPNARVFLTMQLLDGETLAARLRREGRLVPAEALRLFEQVAAGLAAAHAAGVVHRDLKPSNVMLTPDAATGQERAVVMDFGLARAHQPSASGDFSATQTGLVIGTFEYMAPEQMRSEAATPAADVYALGLLLFEMLDGQAPFHGKNTMDAWMRRIREGPPLLAADQRIPGLDPRVDTLIARCLEYEPAARFGSPMDAVAALHTRRARALWAMPRQWRGPSTRQDVAQPGGRWPRRRIAAAGGILALSGVAWRMSNQSWNLRPGARLVLAPLANTTGDRHYDALGQLMRVHLSQSTQFNLVGAAQLAGALAAMLVDPRQTPQPGQYQEAAWRLSAAAVAFGTISTVGSRPALTISLEWRGAQPKTPAHVETQTFSAAEPAALARDAASWLRSAVGDRSTGVALYNRLPEQITTPSWQALWFLSEAEREASARRHNEALLHLESALAADPGFAFAAMRKADVLNTTGRELESLAAWQHANRLLEARPGSRRDELRSRGMFAFDTGDIAGAATQFARLVLEYPNEPAGIFYRHIPLMHLGQSAELVPDLRRGLTLDPSYWQLYSAMAHAGVVTADRALHEEGLAGLETAGQPALAALARIGWCWRAADLQGVLAACRRLQADPAARHRANGYLREGDLYFESGLVSMALAAYRRAEQVAAGDSLAAPQVADALIRQAYCAQGDAAAVDGLLRRAGDRNQSVEYFTHAGLLWAGTGRLKQAAAIRRELARVPECHKTRHSQALIDAALARAGGRFAEAAAQERALDRDLPRFGWHPWRALAESSVTGEPLAEALAMAPALFWSGTYFHQPGQWSACLRAVAGTEKPKSSAAEQLVRMRDALDRFAAENRPRPDAGG